MTFSRLTWFALSLAALALAGWTLQRERPSLLWRWGMGLLAAVVVLYPLERVFARLVILWLYETPSPLLDRIMASRHALPVTFYQHIAERALAWGVWGAFLLVWVLTVALPLRRPQNRRRLLRHPATRAVGGGLLLLVVVFGGYNAWLSARFHRPHPVFYTDCHKVWAHRRNAIPLAERAFDQGAPGIEMDIRYDVARREFFIGRYDEPVPPPGKRVLLADIFARVGQRGYFWLDTKTIHRLTPAQAQQAAQDMRALLDRFGLRQRAIVESDRPSNLRYFAAAGIHTSYWIFNIDETAFPKTPWALWWALVRIKQNYIRYGFSAISMDYRFYTPLVRWMLRGARIHLFTVDNPTTLQQLVSRPEVKVVLTNRPVYNDITACH